MASTGRGISALKAIPGGARPTMPAQGGANVGAISPLAAQLANERGYAAAYGNFLPRLPLTFTQGAFGPMSPILPVPVDEPPEGAERPTARRYEYQIGWNLPVGQPGSEGLKLADFATLRTLADLYSVARTCIQIRKAEIKGLDWDIVPTHDAAKAYHGDRDAMKDFGERRAKALKFFRQPDPDYFSFAQWLDVLLEEIFVFDALSLLVRPVKGRGMGKGLLGSDLGSLEVLSGPTIRPLVGMHGEVPRPPAPAYQQYLYGVPRSDYVTLITQKDIDDGNLAGSEIEQYTGDQLIYMPMVPRRWTPYGFPPIERALIPVMAGLQKQAFQLDYFREGTVPAVYISPGDMNITPNQVRELQDALNAVAGDPAYHHKIIVLPPGTHVEPQRPTQLADQFDEVVMSQVTMAFDVNPMELGLLPRVSTVASPFAAREMAQAGRSIHQRLSTKPLLKFLADIFDGVLHRVVGQDDMKFSFEGLDDSDQVAEKTQLLTQQVQYGLRSVDEARQELELQPWQLPETSGPVYFTAQGPMPFQMASRMLPAAGSQPAKKPGNGQPALPGNPAITPAHAQSLAVVSSGTGRPSSSASSAQDRLSRTGGQVAGQRQGGGRGKDDLIPEITKAVSSELEALARHIRKGRQPVSWQPVHIPDYAPEVVWSALAAGCEVKQAAEYAQAVILADDEYQWVEKAGDDGPKDWPGWRLDLRLVSVYTQRILGAFRDAIKKIVKLIRAWWAGGTTTRPVLTDEIRDELERSLTRVYRPMWREAYHLGSGAAQAAATGTEPSWGRWTPGNSRAASVAGERLRALLQTQGITTIKAVASTRMDELAQAIFDAVQRGEGPGALVADIEHILLVPSRAEMIAQTEITRIQSAAAWQRYKDQGVTQKKWITAADGRVCPVCRANEEQGPIATDALFVSGDPYPPGHPRCRCALVPAKFGSIPLGKASPPESTWGGGYGGGARESPDISNAFPAWAPPSGPGGAARLGDETWGGGHPGADYSRWPRGARAGDTGGDTYSGARSRAASAPDDEDDAAEGGTDVVHNRPRAWPNLNGGGKWPEGGHGILQPQPSALTVPTGRPPSSSAMKAADPHNTDEARRWIRANARKADPALPHKQMTGNFPPRAIAWMKGIKWFGPVEVPLDLIDFDAENRWAASHQSDHVARFQKEIKAGKIPAPGVGVVKPGHNRIRIIDGHHRTMAYKKLVRPARLWVAFVGSVTGPWDKTYLYQVHSGGSPRNKGETGKFDKEVVNYRPASDPPYETCANCVMFSNRACNSVSGDIDPAYTCDYWYRKESNG
jgi:SPP1 gp7 family putative phage head morphogenesis protein